ncbi:hypothetical protein Pla52n_01460 [Stieleria varia]|uniref:Uncharacterized protein n=1 Tax=Stieleria varia TaxID=2528005 RepID=A0A5C6B695_9BACT|nr:hypothetical protein Pla52n_01460 [Stieleria varia]
MVAVGRDSSPTVSNIPIPNRSRRRSPWTRYTTPPAKRTKLKRRQKEVAASGVTIAVDETRQSSEVAQLRSFFRVSLCFSLPSLPSTQRVKTACHKKHEKPQELRPRMDRRMVSSAAPRCRDALMLRPYESCHFDCHRGGDACQFAFTRLVWIRSVVQSHIRIPTCRCRLRGQPTVGSHRVVECDHKPSSVQIRAVLDCRTIPSKA